MSAVSSAQRQAAYAKISRVRINFYNFDPDDMEFAREATALDTLTQRNVFYAGPEFDQYPGFELTLDTREGKLLLFLTPKGINDPILRRELALDVFPAPLMQNYLIAAQKLEKSGSDRGRSLAGFDLRQAQRALAPTLMAWITGHDFQLGINAPSWAQDLVALWFKAMRSDEKKNDVKLFPKLQAQTAPADKPSSKV